MGNDPVLIFGMPRCRTAWLSMCLSALGVDCTHEAMREHGSFERWAADLDERLAEGPAGDADPGLIYFVHEILARWPGARVLVVSRDRAACLNATIEAAPEHQRETLASWPRILQVFRGACDALRRAQLVGGFQVRFLAAEALADDVEAASVLEFLAGRRPSDQWVRQKQRLRVVSGIELGAVTAAPAVPAVPVQELLDRVDVSFAGLNAAMYQDSDFGAVAAWWQEHTGNLLAEAALPPLGVVVSMEGEPCAAVWCYECYGVPVAELTFPVTRPGLSPFDSQRALLYGALACMNAAGKAHEPEARFQTFKVTAPRQMAPALKRLGFREYLTARTPMILQF